MFSAYSWLWVAETSESKTMVKQGLLDFNPSKPSYDRGAGWHFDGKLMRGSGLQSPRLAVSEFLTPRICGILNVLLFLGVKFWGNWLQISI